MKSIPIYRTVAGSAFVGDSIELLGQLEESCLTLNEVQARYPAAEARLLEEVLAKKTALGCL